LYYTVDTVAEVRLEQDSKSRGSTSRGRPGVKNWAEVARLVREYLTKNPSADIREAISRVPYYLWMSIQNRPLKKPKAETVQRWIAALGNIERIEDDTDAEYLKYVQRLRTVPVAAVELISRWHNYDSYNAKGAARAIVEGRWLVEKLRDEEEKARKNTNGVKGRQYVNKLRGQVRDWAPSQLDPDFELRDRKRDDPPADVLFARKSDPSKIAVVLTFGPFTDSSEYLNRYTLFLNAVAGLATYCERVIAIVPDNGMYWQWLQQHGVKGDNIVFFRVHYHAKVFEPVQQRRPAQEN
jgi:hypothetical protein